MSPNCGWASAGPVKVSSEPHTRSTHRTGSLPGPSVGAGAGSAAGVPATVAVQPVPSSTALSTATSARRRGRGAEGICRSGVEDAEPR